MKYLVTVGDRCWLTDGEGDPPRTKIKHNATRFDSVEDAQKAIGKARKTHPTRNRNYLLECDL